LLIGLVEFLAPGGELLGPLVQVGLLCGEAADLLALGGQLRRGDITFPSLFKGLCELVRLLGGFRGGLGGRRGLLCGHGRRGLLHLGGGVLRLHGFLGSGRGGGGLP